MFFSRLSSTLFLWSVITVALWLKLDWLLLAMMALVGVLGTWEYVSLQNADEGSKGIGRLVLWSSLIYWVALLTLYWRSGQRGEPPWWLDGILIAIGLQGVFVLALRRGLEGEKTLLRIFHGVFGLVYTVLLWGYMAKLLLLTEAKNGQLLVLAVILVTKFGDMGAYVFGSLFGRHKMIPHISPAKTWEGFGGAIFSSCLGMGVMLLVCAEGSFAPLSAGKAMLLAPILAVLGVIGDLAESVLKRCHQIKDSGHKLPGIGGILDLTDSLLFTAPAAYFYILWMA